jgi:hypothetical protein
MHESNVFVQGHTLGALASSSQPDVVFHDSIMSSHFTKKLNLLGLKVTLEKDPSQLDKGQ